MNKKTLSLTLTSPIASSLLSIAPSIQAGENPFALSSINTTQQLAADEKSTEASCGAKKNAGEKAAEAKCGADKQKMTEGKCGADKMKGAGSSKAAEAKCGANKTETAAPAETGTTGQ